MANAAERRMRGRQIGLTRCGITATWRSESGLPIGAQIIGGYLQDLTAIAFAGMIEQEFGGFSPPPDLV